MIRFCYLNKQEKEQWLPLLFDILYDNMSVIAPSGKSYDDDKAEWMEEVSHALDKQPRQIIMVFVDEVLAGYVQYYTKDDLLMIEEVQLKERYQRTRMLYLLCKHLSDALPENIRLIEAYAHKTNLNSRSVMKNLGMEELGEQKTPFGELVHLSGSVQYIKYKKLSRH